jgi:hypothetical protein
VMRTTTRVLLQDGKIISCLIATNLPGDVFPLPSCS